LDWNTVIGISSVIIALCALAFTVWQSKQAQKHNKLSFRPHLTSWSHEDPDNKVYSAELMNNGLGPAIIDDYIFKIDGAPITGEGAETVEKALKRLFPNIQYASDQAYMAKGYSMAAKEKRKILEIRFHKDTNITPDEIHKAFKRTDLIINYKSFYNEKFTYSSENNKSNK